MRVGPRGLEVAVGESESTFAQERKVDRSNPFQAAAAQLHDLTDSIFGMLDLHPHLESIRMQPDRVQLILFFLQLGCGDEAGEGGRSTGFEAWR